MNRSTLLPSLLVPLLLILCSAQVFAQPSRKKVNFDTITLARLQAGEPIRDIGVKVIEPIDTMLSGGSDGVSLLKFNGTCFGLKGEYRIVTKGSIIHQITFSVQAKDSADAARNFENLDAIIEKQYGNPNEGYTNVYKMIRWNGKQQSLALQTKDGTSYVSVILSEIDKPVKR